MTTAQQTEETPPSSQVELDLESIVADQLDQLERDVKEHATFRLQVLGAIGR